MIEYTWIYALVDPRTDEVRYIGKADNPKYRLKGHLKLSSLKDKTYKNHWIKELLFLGLKPVLKPFARIPVNQWEEVEQALIAAARKRGWNLTNLTNGGEGASGCKRSLETRKKIAKARIGLRPSPETRLKMSIQAKTHKHSPKVYAEIREKNKGRKRTEQSCTKMRNAKRKKAISKYVGVFYSNTKKYGGKWRALINNGEKRFHLGYFFSEEEAYEARLQAEVI